MKIRKAFTMWWFDALLVVLLSLVELNEMHFAFIEELNGRQDITGILIHRIQRTMQYRPWPLYETDFLVIINY